MVIKEFTKSEIKELIKEKNLLPFNREVVSQHVTKMAKSVAKCGVLRAPVIGVLKYHEVDRYAIIDGQHLCKAITLTTGRDKVQCVVKEYTSKKDVIQDIAVLNNTQKTWNDLNYLIAWYKYGNDNEFYHQYSTLYNEYTNTDISIGLLISIFTSDKTGFKEGRLTFRDRDFSYKILTLVNYLKNEWNLNAHTLTGLVVWCNNSKFTHKVDIDFKYLKRLIKDELELRPSDVPRSRDEFAEFLSNLY